MLYSRGDFVAFGEAISNLNIKYVAIILIALCILFIPNIEQIICGLAILIVMLLMLYMAFLPRKKFETAEEEAAYRKAKAEHIGKLEAEKEFGRRKWW